MASPSTSSLFRSLVRPALWVLLIPVISLIFFKFAERKMDAIVLREMLGEVNAEKSLTPKERVHFREVVSARPVSKILESDAPEDIESATAFSSELKQNYTWFRWMVRLGWACLAIVGLTSVAAGILALLGYRTQPALYRSMRIAWPLLFVAAALLVMLQGVLAVALSYWGTVVLMDSYVPKLILLAGLLVLAGVAAIFLSVFRKVDSSAEIRGKQLREEEAPQLWSHVVSMAERMGTSPPRNIITGVEPNFFVTEQTARCEDGAISGRTLFLSLPMLKVLTKSEADAVLAHELAHFSGQDTYWSQRVGPLMNRFSIHLAALGEGLSLPVGKFMLLNWSIFLSLTRRLSRQREFRADRCAADITSPRDIAAALVKIAGYCDHYSATLTRLFSQRELPEGFHLASLLENSFPDSLKHFASVRGVFTREVPHPFDTHPTLAMRMESLGLPVSLEPLDPPALLTPPADSLINLIPVAAAREDEMWNKIQKSVAEVHADRLAWTLPGDSEEERKAVEDRFPQREFNGMKGHHARLDKDSLFVSTWPEPVGFHSISDLSLVHGFFGGEQLKLTVRREKKLKALFLPRKQFLSADGDLFDYFKEYYLRYEATRNSEREIPTQTAQHSENFQ